MSALPYRFNERALVIGSTGSGKSELINLIFAGVRCQRVLVDTKDEFAIPGVEPVRDVGDLDWSQRTLHIRMAPTASWEEFDQLFRALYHRHNMVVAVHELGDVCEFQPSRTPRWFNAYLSKGRARGLGLLAGTQRPVQVPVRARSESEHVFMVGERLQVPSDQKAVADAMGQDPGRLARLIDDTQARLGGEPDPQGRTHAYLGFDRNRRQLTAYPPIPAEHRRALDVHRALAIDAHHPAAGNRRVR